MSSISSTCRHADSEVERTRADQHRQLLAARGRQLLRVAQALDRPQRIRAPRRPRPRDRPAGRARLRPPRRAATRASARAQQLQHRSGGLGGARPAAGSGGWRESGRRAAARRAASSNCACSAAAKLRPAHLFLQEFRHQRLTGQQVGEREIWQAHHAQCTQHEGGHGTQAVRDHHRASAQQGLEAGGAGGHQGDIRGLQRKSRLPVEQANAGRGRPGRSSSRSRSARSGGAAMGAMNCAAGQRLARIPAAAKKSGPRRATSARRLPGSSATTAPSARKPRARRAARAVDVQRNLIGQRMAHEFGAHRVARVKRRLEGQQAQHQVAGSGDVTDPPLPPRPHLRTHVLNGLDARRVQVRGQPEIELRGVDADKHVRPPGARTRAAGAPAAAAGEADAPALPPGP